MKSIVAKIPLKIIFVFCFIGLLFLSSSAFAANNSVDPSKKDGDCEKEVSNPSDSTISRKNKQDSVIIKEEKKSSMSSMSYNVLFQVIYRNSISEFFNTSKNDVTPIISN